MLGVAATLGVSPVPTALIPDDAVGSTSRAHLYAGHPDHGDPPSIALVVADDLGYADAGFTGAGGVAATPHLDALASAGVRLDRHYVQPICSPTRAALLTGRHVLRYGLQNAVIWPSAAWSLPKNETLMAEHLRAAGYRTAILGKWHLGMHASWALPRARGFDEQLGMYTGTVDYFRHTTRDGAVDWHYNDSRVETRDNGTYSSVVLGAAAADFVERNARRKWFLYLAMQSVHHPLHAPEECLARYPQLSGEVKARAAMVSALDDAVGELTTALERSGQAKRTLVLFLSDNGAPYIDAVFDHDLRDEGASSLLDLELVAVGSRSIWKGARRPPPGVGSPPHGITELGDTGHAAGGGSNYPYSGWKHWVFEGGVRSAAFVWWAPLNRARGGSSHGGLFHAVDWMPTLVKLAGGSTATSLPLDGYDVLPALMEGGAASPRDEVPVNIAACGPDAHGTRSIIDGPQAAIVVGELKLVVDCFWRSQRDLARAQLFNLTADAAEAHDLAGRRQDDVRRLAERLAAWEAKAVDPYELYAIDASCGKGRPQGSPPAWTPWCDGAHR